jgi:hypothetical protein
MKPNIRLCVSAIIVFGTAVLLFMTRSVPTTQLWKGYRVLFVTGADVKSSQVLATLENNGCTGVICKETQRFPVVSQFAPIQPVQSLSYITERDAFFTDKSGSGSVFYIPDHQEKMITAAVKSLNSLDGIKAGTDGAGSFPWITPVIVTIFFILCFLFSSDRRFFLLCSIFPLLFSWCNPFYTVAAASCFCLTGFYFTKKLWGRSYFALTAVTSPFLMVLFIFPAVILLFSSPFRSFLYGCSCAGSLLLLYLYTKGHDRRIKSMQAFSPVPILSARAVQKPERRELLVLGYTSGAVICLLVISVFSLSMAGQKTNGTTTVPQLPTPVRHAPSDELPDLERFTQWGWNTLTFPYRKLDEAYTMPEEKMVVSIPEYKQEKDGIMQHESVEFVYNDAFRNSLYHMVQNLDYPALEQMLLRQGKKMQFAYTRNKGTSAERFSSIILLLFAAMPFLITGYCLVVRKK